MGEAVQGLGREMLTRVRRGERLDQEGAMEFSLSRRDENGEGGDGNEKNVDNI